MADRNGGGLVVVVVIFFFIHGREVVVPRLRSSEELNWGELIK